MDTITIGAEKNYFGLRLNVLVPVNLAYESKAEGIGLVNGRIGKYKSGDRENQLFTIYRLYISRSHIGDSIDSGMYEIIGEAEPRDFTKEFQYVLLNSKRCSSYSVKMIYRNRLYVCKNYYTNRFYQSFITFKPEIVFGYNYGIRLGFSFTETFDFILGFLGIDFMGDDYDNDGGIRITQKQNREIDKFLSDAEIEEYLKTAEQEHNKLNLFIRKKESQINPIPNQ